MTGFSTTTLRRDIRRLEYQVTNAPVVITIVFPDGQKFTHEFHPKDASTRL